jgi:WhiB family transcriptional regulator, redox-sensing transcriptional regulator
MTCGNTSASTPRYGQMMRNQSWEERAACRGTDVELFYSDQQADIKRALALCAHCEVRAACYDQAMRDREAFGIWGGTEERYRRRLFRAQRRGADTPASAA